MTIWNTKGKLKAVSVDNNHLDCVTKIKFSPNNKFPYYASVGWDGRIKIWSKFFKLFCSVKAHESPVNALDIAKNGSIFGTGCKDNEVKIWNL